MNNVGVQAVLTTGRTLKQGSAMEKGKLSKAYQKEVSTIDLDSVSLEVLGIETGDTVRVETVFGSVILTARLNRRMEPGVVFVPCGPYANVVIGSDTEQTGMPDFKGIPCQVFAVSDSHVLDIADLLRNAIGGI
jgi:formylmethanofuran dehydrogenase subunit D